MSRLKAFFSKKTDTSKQDYQNRRNGFTDRMKKALGVPTVAGALSKAFNKAEAAAKDKKYAEAQLALDEVERLIKLSEGLPPDPTKALAVAEKLNTVWMPTLTLPVVAQGLTDQKQSVVLAMNGGKYDEAGVALKTLDELVTAAVSGYTAYNDAIGGVEGKVNDLGTWAAPEAGALGNDLAKARQPAAAGDYATAANLVKGVGERATKLHALYPGRKDWADKAAVRKTTGEQIGELEGLKAAAAGGLKNELTAIDQDATDTAGKYAEAVTALDNLANRVGPLLTTTKADRDEYLKAVNEVEGPLAELEKWLAKEGGVLRGEFTQAKKPAEDSGDYAGAKGLVEAVGKKVADQPAAAWEGMAGDRKDARRKIGELKGRRSPAADGLLNEWQTLEQAAKGGNYKEAVTKFPDLHARVTDTHTKTPKPPPVPPRPTPPEVEEFLGIAIFGAMEKVAYLKALKVEQKRIGLIDQAVKDKKYGNPPAPDPVKTAVEKFTTTRAEVLKAQKAEDYVAALEKLKELVKAMAALEKARLDIVDTEIKGATTPGKVKDVVKKLLPNEITALGPDKQVALLETLRQYATGGKKVEENDKDPVGTELFQARCAIYDNMRLQPEFVKKDKELRNDVAKAFENDAEFEKAKKGWATMDKKARFEFLSYAAKKQCKVMGQPEPDVVPDDTAKPKRCANYKYTCTGAVFECQTKKCKKKTWTGSNSDSVGLWNTFECGTCSKAGKVKKKTTCAGKTWYLKPGDKLVCPTCGAESVKDKQRCKATWPNVTGKGPCKTCTGVDTCGEDVDFGGCNLGLINGATKSTIALNSNDNVIGDFEETFNTIMHENAHNYQLYLIKRYREDKNKLFKEIPYAKEIEAQIMMWDENARGYVPEGSTYDKQPLEEHAWGFGNKVAAKRLKPKPKKGLGDLPGGVNPLNEPT